MSQEIELNLGPFEAALNELSRQVDDPGADPARVAPAAAALFQGMAGAVLLQGPWGGESPTSWDGTFAGNKIMIFKPGCQFSATVQLGNLQSCILNAPSGRIWTILRSQKGLHVTVASPVDGTIHDLLFTPQGQVVNERDIGAKFTEMRSTLEKIYSLPPESLPDYKPSSEGTGSVSGMLEKAGEGILGSVAEGGAVILGGVLEKIGNRAPSPDSGKNYEKATMKASPTLVLIDFEGQRHSVETFPFTLGRSENTDFRLGGTLVSRKHARIALEEGQFWVEDLGSVNGTRLNDRKIRGREKLKPRDQIAFADQVFTVEISGLKEEDKATVAFSLEEKIRQQEKREAEEKPAQLSSVPPAPVSAPPSAAVISHVSPPSPPPPPPPPPRKKVQGEVMEKASPPPLKGKKGDTLSCPKCGAETDGDGAFCSRCGSRLLAEKRSCRFCGKEMKEGANFCSGCGKNQNEAAAPIPASRESQGPGSSLKEDVSSQSPPPRRKNPRESRKGGDKQKTIDSTIDALEKETEAGMAKKSLSLRFWAFLFGIALILDRIQLINRAGPGIVEDQNFQALVGLGFWVIFCSMIAGASTGFFRSLSFLSGLGFLFYEGFMKKEILRALLENPDLLSGNPGYVLTLGVLATSFFLTLLAWIK